MRRVACFVLLSIASCKPRTAPLARDTATPLPLAGFEGEIDMTAVLTLIPGEAPTTFDFVVELKGNKVRSEKRTERVHQASITDGDAKMTWSLDLVARTYDEGDLAQLGTSTATPAPKAAGADTVAGTPCDRWEIDELLGRTTFCLATGIRLPFMARAAPTGEFASSVERDRLLAKGFPLRDVTRGPTGATLFRMEATRIVPRPVADSEFVVPAGYVKAPPLELHVQ